MTDELLLKRLSEQWLPEIAAGRMSATELAERILQLATQPGAVHQVDTDRQRRCGFGEVIYGVDQSPRSPSD